MKRATNTCTPWLSAGLGSQQAQQSAVLMSEVRTSFASNKASSAKMLSSAWESKGSSSAMDTCSSEVVAKFSCTQALVLSPGSGTGELQLGSRG